MRNFENAKIYKIVSRQGDELYIGSTTARYLSTRLAQHAYNWRKVRAGQLQASCTSFMLFDKYGCDNCDIELVEEFPCSNNKELAAREAFHARNTENIVNRRIEGRTPEQYRQENRERILARRRERRMARMQAQAQA